MNKVHSPIVHCIILIAVVMATYTLPSHAVNNGTNSASAFRQLIEPSPLRGERLDLGSLEQGLQWVFPFDGHLRSFSPDGHEGLATFTRNSRASQPDLSLVEMGQPRFFPGHFEQGVFVEYSQLDATRGAVGYNHFSAGVASIESIATNAFIPIGDAKVSASPDALTGDQALRVQTKSSGDGIETIAVVVPKTAEHVVSLYIRADMPDTELSLSAWVGDNENPREQVPLVVGTEWRRVTLRFRCSDESIPAHSWRGDSKPMRFRIVAKGPTIFYTDAWMFEAQARYGGRKTASSWLPGHTGRSGEILRTGEPVSANSGTLAFWTSIVGDMGWRVLLAVGYDGGWHPDLRIDLRNQRQLEIYAKGENGTVITARAKLAKPLIEGDWHHVTMTWDEQVVRLYLDGELIVTMDNAPVRSSLGEIVLGGVQSNQTPAVRADAVFEDFAHWDRALTPDEVIALASRKRTLLAGFSSHGLFVEDGEPIHVFARDYNSRNWSLILFNRGELPRQGLQVEYGIAGVFEQKIELPDIPHAHAIDIELSWSPALLSAGDYVFEIKIVEGDKVLTQLNVPTEIVPARIPMKNAQILSWGGYSRAMAEAGVTAGGLACGWQGPAPHQLAKATQNGLYTLARVTLTGDAASEQDYFVDAAGRRGRVDQARPGPTADIQLKAEALGETLANMPDVRFAIWNCESQWIWNVDFRPQTIESVRQRFGLDLNLWQTPPVENANRVQHPYGRLQYAAGAVLVPPDGIVKLDHPFYAFSRWWQSGEVGNEVFLADKIATIVRALAPQVQNIWEPALRRPAVRVFTEQDILNEWFYYASPSSAVWIQENLAAASRGSRARISGMPQFLLKPGMAAPYGGMPTPSLYRETTWHCLARPLVGLTYWNLWSVFERGDKDNVKVQEEIDELLGKTPAWKEAAGKIKLSGEWSSLFLWIPELPAEVKRLHFETVHPLGALWPRWQNCPRRIAIVRSFAGQLFNNVRWPGPGALGKAVAETGFPFDVLYDQDFENNPEVLKNYAVVAVPEAPVITEPMAKAFRNFLNRGGLLMVDNYFRADFPDVKIIDFSVGASNRKAMQETEQKLLAEYKSTDHVLYIEGMEDARRRFFESGGPAAIVDKLIRNVDTYEVETQTGNVFINALEAGGARYIVAVNSLSVPGRWYGHFERTLGQGVAQTATLTVDSDFGKVAYRLPEGGRVDLIDNGTKKDLHLPLGPSDGAVVIFLPEEIAAIKITSAPETATPGQCISLSASLHDRNGELVPGVVPVRVEIRAPDNKLIDLSRYDAFIDGNWSMKIPVAYNQPTGVYQLKLTDLASGCQARQSWKVE